MSDKFVYWIPWIPIGFATGYCNVVLQCSFKWTIGYIEI